jgi:tetratricopeptide (TPR) repeat protein
MTFRTLAAPVALAALLLGLTGCGAMKMTSSEPADQDALTAGNAAYEQKDYAKACQALSKAGTAIGAEALYRAGDACFRDGQAKAERSFKAALSANAAYAPAMEGLGLTTLAGGDISRARDQLEAAAKAGGKDPRAAMALGDAYLLSGQCDKALAAYQEALRRDPGLSPAKNRLESGRLVCTAKRGPTPAAAAGTTGAAGAAGATGSSAPASSSQPAGPKEPAKTKAAPKTIDLNDI